MSAGARKTKTGAENAVQLAALPNPFALWRGGSLTDGVIAYETWGRLSAARDNAILLFTGLSPTASVIPPA